jgi:RNA polymerase sigma-70 factor (ECF subfamily)
VLSTDISLIRQGGETKAQTGLKSKETFSDLELLIAKCIKKDSAAQEHLYKTYYGKMMAMAMRYLSNRDDALDALNIGFLKVYQNLQHFDKKGSFDGWVYLIIRNSVIDQLRSRINYCNVEGGSTELLEVSIAETVSSHLNAQDLLQLLYKVPETSRLVFNLFALEGFKHEEIAQMLKISEGTSKWHVAEARRILKSLLEKK